MGLFDRSRRAPSADDLRADDAARLTSARRALAAAIQRRTRVDREIGALVREAESADRDRRLAISQALAELRRERDEIRAVERVLAADVERKRARLEGRSEVEVPERPNVLHLDADDIRDPAPARPQRPWWWPF